MDKERLQKVYREATKTMRTRQEPRIIYADIPTFMEFPRAHDLQDLEEANVVFMGFPHEGFRPYSPTEALPPEGAKAPPDSIYFRTGTDEAPASVRKWAIHHSIYHYGGRGYLVDYDIALTDYLRVVDYGDVDCIHGKMGENIQLAREKIRRIVSAGAIPLIQGGDHSTPIPGLMAISDCTAERIGIIGFDSHFDLLGGDMDASNEWFYSAASQYIRALEMPNIEPENIVLIGMRGIHNPQEWAIVARELGISYFTMKAIDEIGLDRVMAEAIEKATHGTGHLYVTLDVDVIDCTACPGQRMPDTPGLMPREIVKALRLIGEAAVISGFDISELSPQYDPKGATQLLAARCFMEVIAGIATQFRQRNIKKWFQRS